MAHASNRTKNQANQRQREEARMRQNEKDVIFDTAAVFTCAHEISEDFAGQCEQVQNEVEADLKFTALACEIWANRSGLAKQLTDTLADFAAERARHAAVLAALEKRFGALGADASFDEHLDPVEPYRELVRQRIFPDHPTTY